jgi:hypothetical protein
MAQAPPPGGFRLRPGWLLAAAVLLALAAFFGRGHGAPDPRPIGLFTSLPILWRETGDLADLLKADTPPHWALAVLAGRGRVQPLDTLTGKDGTLPLTRRALLIMVQPRPLSPAENVALDDWVRAGGRVLLFADPMLTARSPFALGDKRRPQDIVLLSPILARWGLALQFDEGQPFGTRDVALLGGQVPVNLPGRFAIHGAPTCRLLAAGLAARCRIGSGEVLAIADAALLEDGTSGDQAQRRAMLERILRAFAG